MLTSGVQVVVWFFLFRRHAVGLEGSDVSITSARDGSFSLILSALARNKGRFDANIASEKK